MAEPFLLASAADEPDRDERAIRLLKKGDPEGLRLLQLAHTGRVKALLQKEFGKMLDELQIDDALGQALLRAWQARERIDPAKGTLRSWFYVIARNCARRVLETSRRHAHAPLDAAEDGYAVQAPVAEAEVEAPAESGFVRDLRECIARLAPLQRAVVMADLAAGGMAPADDLAAQLVTTTNSIYVTRNSARKALRKMLEALGHQPGSFGSFGSWRREDTR